MANLKQKFGKKLQVLRKASGLTQEQVAQKTNLTIESISNIERGVHGPTFDNLEKIAKALNVEVKVLFDF